MTDVEEALLTSKLNKLQPNAQPNLTPNLSPALKTKLNPDLNPHLHRDEGLLCMHASMYVCMHACMRSNTHTHK
jgi:hypothetical protein